MWFFWKNHRTRTEVNLEIRGTNTHVPEKNPTRSRESVIMQSVLSSWLDLVITRPTMRLEWELTGLQKNYTHQMRTCPLLLAQLHWLESMQFPWYWSGIFTAICCKPLFHQSSYFERFIWKSTCFAWTIDMDESSECISQHWSPSCYHYFKLNVSS